MTDTIIIAVVLVIVVLAGWYICKAKKSGKKCIGCPNSCCCPSAQKDEASRGCCGTAKNEQ